MKRKKASPADDRLASDIGSLASAILPFYVTMPAGFRDAYDRFNAIVRAGESGMRLSASTPAGASFWSTSAVDDFWLRRFAIVLPTAADQPPATAQPEEPKAEDWPGWEVLYVEWLIRNRMLPRSQRAITEHTARVSSGEPSFLCVAAFGGQWYLEAGRRDDDDLLARAATGGLDPFALARGRD